VIICIYNMEQTINKNQFQNQISTKSLKVMKGILKILPRWFVLFVMEVLFFTAYFWLKDLRRICMRNLQSVYGKSKNQDEYKAMTKGCIKNIGHSMMDLLYFVEHPKEFSEIIEIENEDHLKEAFQLGQGVIAVSAHLSNFPLLFVSLVQRGYKVNVIIRPMRDSKFSKLIFGLCAKWGINMITTLPQRRFVKESLGALRRNELLFILSDEVVPEGQGVVVNFLNQQVARTTGPMIFHDKTGAPLVPIFIVTDKKRNFKICIEPALKIEKTLTADENIIINISNITNVIETIVKKHPIQWAGWLNKRWISNHSTELPRTNNRDTRLDPN